MAEYGGFLIIIDEPSRASQLADRLEYAGEDWAFTDALSVPDWHPKHVELCLLCLGGDTVDYACLAKRGKRVATSKYQVKFTEFVPLNQLSFDDVRKALGARYRLHFVRSSTGMGSRLGAGTWASLLSVLKELRPAQVDDLDRLERMRRNASLQLRGERYEVMAMERDAIGLALEVFAGSAYRRQSLPKWDAPEGDAPAPFIKGLSSLGLREDTVINHDARRFGDWSPVREYVVGALELAREGERLTILNANRTRVEQALGVDLLYYHHRYGSYVMVQYKLMTDEHDTGDLGYRPGGEAYETEMQRIREFIRQHPDPGADEELGSYRLHSGAFYMKICANAVLDLASPSLMSGMYLPLDYWEAFCTSSHIRGRRGGRKITYRNVGRYMDNGLFVGLVQAGWIGSRGRVSDTISLVLNSLDARKSVVAAISSRSTDGIEDAAGHDRDRQG